MYSSLDLGLCYTNTRKEDQINVSPGGGTAELLGFLFC